LDLYGSQQAAVAGYRTHITARNSLHGLDQRRQPQPLAIARSPLFRPLGHPLSFSDSNRQPCFGNQSTRYETVPQTMSKESSRM
jgi:hypothetical protein